MPFKPNYRFERAERARSKEARKLQKLETQAAKRKADAISPEPDEDRDEPERASEKED